MTGHCIINYAREADMQTSLSAAANFKKKTIIRPRLMGFDAIAFFAHEIFLKYLDASGLG
jgi:hypothetical protein